MSDVNFSLNLAVENFTRQLEQANKATEAFHKDFQKNTSTSSLAVANFIGSLALKTVEKFGEVVAGAFHGMIEEAIEAEKSVHNLEMALKTAGIYSAKTSIDLQDFAMTIQKTSNYTDDAAMSSMTLLANLTTLDKEGIKKATQSAADLASTFDMDLGQATELVAKAFNGQISAFGRMGIQITKGKNDSETYANTLKVLSEFSGNASKKTETFEGAMINLKKAYGDVLENAGSYIVQSPKLISLIMSTAEGFNKLADGVFVFGDFLSKNEDSLKVFAISFGVLSAAVVTYTAVVNAATIATKLMNTALKLNPIGLVVTAIAALALGITYAYKNLDFLKEKFWEMTKGALMALLPLEQAINSVFHIDTNKIGAMIGTVNGYIKDLRDKNANPIKLIDNDGGKDIEALIEADRVQEEMSKKRQARLDAEAQRRWEDGAKEREELAKKIAAEQDWFNAQMQSIEAIRISKENLNQELLSNDINYWMQRNAEFNKYNSEMALAEVENSKLSVDAKNQQRAAILAQQALDEETDLANKNAYAIAEIERTRDLELQKANALIDENEKRKAIVEAQNKYEIDTAKQDTKYKIDMESQQNKSRLTLYKEDVEAKKRSAAEKKLIEDTVLNATSTFLQAAGSLMKQNSTEAKALAITDATIKTYQAANMALASSPPPYSYIAAAASIAAGLANVIKIKNAGSYENGGFIGGNSFTGDRLVANVNSGEAILNTTQQKNFMDMANGGGNNELLQAILDALRNLKLVANETELARAVSIGVQNGIVIGESR